MKGVINMINKFSGKYAGLSNAAPCAIMYNNLVFGNVEAAFQAQKVTDPAIKREFCFLPAKEAKQKGNQVNLRDDWKDIKLIVMAEILFEKFTRNADLAHLLRSTGEERLVYENTEGDTFWGVCNGFGENNLGQILMDIREAIG